MDQQITKPISEFGPWDWQIEPWRNVNEVMLLTGSAGGGKSRLAGEKIHGFLLHYGGATGVISRKAEDDMKQIVKDHTNAEFLFTSAKNGTNAELAFTNLVRLIIQEEDVI